MPDAVPGSFTILNQGISNILTNDVSIVPSADESTKPVVAKALWDTGAMCTVVSNDVADKLNLKQVSIEVISTPSGTMQTKMFVVDLILPNDIKIKQVQVLGAYPSSCDVLIGMDVIGLGDFAVTNFLNQTAFSFQIPSKVRIDFTK
jgi:predicted aspartyl protease